jgi:hypothetical protein
MGAWGYGIEEHDTVLDVLDIYVERLKATQNLAAAAEAVRIAFREPLADPDAAVMVRIGLALATWRYGDDDAALVAAVAADAESRRGFDDYNDPAARARAVRRFVDKIAKPNPRPRAIPKPPRPRKPKAWAFEAGDCLVLQLPGGRHAAALVLVAARDAEGDGYNIIARLKWPAPQAPSAIDFAPLAQGPREVHQPMSTIEVAMFPPKPYAGRAKLACIARIEVQPDRFAIRRNEHGDWESSRTRSVSFGLASRSWDALAGLGI